MLDPATKAIIEKALAAVAVVVSLWWMRFLMNSGNAKGGKKAPSGKPAKKSGSVTSQPLVGSSGAPKKESTGKLSGYYYKDNNSPHLKDGEKWDGKAEPKLLSKAVVAGGGAASAASPRTSSPLAKWAFSDESAKATVYIPFGSEAGWADLAESDVTLESNVTSLRLTIDNVSGKRFCLEIKRLQGEIASAKFKLKADKIVVTLQKKKAKAWPSLAYTKPAKPSKDDDDDDY